MKTVNYGAPYTHRLTLRLTDEQYTFLLKIGEFLGTSPSDYLRMCVNTAMITKSAELEKLMKGEVGMPNENVETDINDKL